MRLDRKATLKFRHMVPLESGVHVDVIKWREPTWISLLIALAVPLLTTEQLPSSGPTKTNAPPRISEDRR